MTGPDPRVKRWQAGPGQLTWQAVTVLFHSTIFSGCRITSWYTSSAGQGRKVCGRGSRLSNSRSETSSDGETGQEPFRWSSYLWGLLPHSPSR